MLLNHFQTMAIVGLSDASAPTVLADFFRGQQTASSFNPNLSFASCEVTPDYRARFILTAVSPYAFFAIFAVILGARLLKQRLSTKNTDDVNLFDDNAYYEAEAQRNRREMFNELGMEGGAGALAAQHGASMRDEVAVQPRMPMGTAVDPYFPRDKYMPSLRAEGVDAPVEEDPIPPAEVDNFDAMAELLRSSDDFDGLAVTSGTPQPSAVATTGRSAGSGSNNEPPEGAIETLAERSLRKSLLLQWFDLVAVTFVIVLHMLYPTILEVSGNLLVCEDIDMGAGAPPRSVLVADRSIDCNSDEYAQLRVLAFAHLIGYGVGLPLLLVLVVKLVAVISMKGVAKEGDALEDSKRLFFFVTGGFADNRWFWESVVLARKAAVVMVAVSVSDPKMRVYAGMWTMTAAFLLNAIVLPYNDKLLYRLETASLLSIAVTLNLTLLFGFYDADATPVEFYAALVAIFIVQIAVMLAFVFGLLVAGREKLLSLARNNPKVFGWIARVIEGDGLAAAEAKTKQLQDEIDQLHQAIEGFTPRVAAISALLPPASPDARGMVLAVERKRAEYVDYLAAAAVRITRFDAHAEELRVLYAMEMGVLEAELARIRAFNNIDKEVEAVSGGGGGCGLPITGVTVPSPKRKYLIELDSASTRSE